MTAVCRPTSAASEQDQDYFYIIKLQRSVSECKREGRGGGGLLKLKIRFKIASGTLRQADKEKNCEANLSQTSVDCWFSLNILGASFCKSFEVIRFKYVR